MRPSAQSSSRRPLSSTPGGEPSCSTAPLSRIATGRPCQACSAVPARAEGAEAGLRGIRRSAAARLSSSAAISSSRSIRASHGAAATVRPMRASSSSGMRRFRPTPITAQMPPSGAAWVSISTPASLPPSLSTSFGHFSCTCTPQRGQRLGQRDADRQRQAGQLLRAAGRISRPAKRSANRRARTASCGRRARGPAVWCSATSSSRARPAWRRAPAGRHWWSRFRRPLRPRRRGAAALRDRGGVHGAALRALCGARENARS